MKPRLLRNDILKIQKRMKFGAWIAVHYYLKVVRDGTADGLIPILCYKFDGMFQVDSSNNIIPVCLTF